MKTPLPPPPGPGPSWACHYFHLITNFWPPSMTTSSSFSFQSSHLHHHLLLPSYLSPSLIPQLFLINPHSCSLHYLSTNIFIITSASHLLTNSFNLAIFTSSSYHCFYPSSLHLHHLFTTCPSYPYLSNTSPLPHHLIHSPSIISHVHLSTNCPSNSLPLCLHHLLKHWPFIASLPSSHVLPHITSVFIPPQHPTISP